MQEQFSDGAISGSNNLKPIADEVDELFGPMFGLSPEEIEYVKGYDTGYGRGAPEDASISDFE